MISAVFDGAAHLTVAGCLGAFFFKQTVVDRTSKVVKEAENITATLVIRILYLCRGPSSSFKPNRPDTPQ
jgi:hypothetical protein